MLATESIARGLPLDSADFLRLLDSLPDTTLFCVTPRGRVSHWNAGAASMFGFAEAEILHQDYHLLRSAEDIAAGIPDNELSVAIDENQCGREGWLVRKDETQFWAAVTTRPLWSDDGRLSGFAFMVRDLTELRRLHNKHQEIEQRFRGIFDQTFECVVLLRPDGTVVEVNQATLASRNLKPADMLGQPLWDTPWLSAATEVRQAVQSAVLQAAAGKLCRDELEMTEDDGGQRVFDFSVKPIIEKGERVALLIAEARDITERKRLEAQLHQRQKIEAIGQLAGGIAHDFNNLLVVINGYSDFLLHLLPADDATREPVGEILKAGERAAALTRQLLAFSRLQILAPKVLDLNAVVIDIEKMLRRIIGEDVDFATALEPGLWPVLADAGQMEQILLNLVINARDAMPRGGKLTIATRNVKLDASYTQSHLDANPGRHVLLSVSDTGCGMTEEVKRHMFEPFFTTKDVGKGTGLGLSTVFGIVKQSGGTLEVYSEPGQGTTFKMYLPEAPLAAQARQPLSGTRPPPRGSETILLVEDEAAVRAFSRQALRSWGYKILEAADGLEALRVAQQYHDAIHLLLTDVVMPNLGGHQLAEKLRPLHPESKVLYISGFTDDAIVRHGILEAHVQFLQKPFSLVTLAHKVREVLDAP